MASNQVIQSISDELDSLLNAIQSFELTSSGNSRSSSRNQGTIHTITEEEDGAEFTPVILRKKHLSNTSYQDHDLTEHEDEEDLTEHARDDHSKNIHQHAPQVVANELNQILRSRLSPANTLGKKVKPIPPARTPSPAELRVEESVGEEFDPPLPPPPVDFLMEALAAKLSPKFTPKEVDPKVAPEVKAKETLLKESPAPSPRGGSPKPPPRIIAVSSTGCLSQPGSGKASPVAKPRPPETLNQGNVAPPNGSPRAAMKSRARIKLMIEPETDGNKVKYIQIKMLALTGSEDDLIGKLLVSAYTLQAKPEPNSTTPRVVQSKSAEVQIGDAISVKIDGATSLEEMKEHLAVLASGVKAKLEARAFHLYDWRSESKPYDAKIGFGSWDGIIVYEKILMYKKIISGATSDTDDDFNYVISP